MLQYKYAALLVILIYSIIYCTIIPVTNDTFSHSQMVISWNYDYPPLFHLLVKIPQLVLNLPYSWVVWLTFLTGSVITLTILPYFVYNLYLEYSKSSKIAFFSLFAYLFSTAITNYYYYANLWAQTLGTIFLLIMITYLMKREHKKASIFLFLLAMTHRTIILYALLIFVVYFAIKRINEKNLVNLGGAYCLSKAGEISYSLSCYIPLFIIVYPFWLLFTIRNAMWKTLNDKLFLAAAIIPLIFAFQDLRVFLGTFTFLSYYIGVEMNRNKKTLIVIVALSIIFAIFSYLYTLDIAKTAIS